MYVPPHLKKFQGMFTGTARPEVRHNVNEYHHSVPTVPTVPIKEEPSKKKDEFSKIHQMMKELKESGRRTLVIKNNKDSATEEEPEHPHARPNDFWYDIYNPERYELFPESEKNYDRLVWNNAISKQSMVKLLKEQGTIKFNPIEYYKNTVQTQAKIDENAIDAIYTIIYKFLINYTKTKNIHSMKPEDFDFMVEEIKKRVYVDKNEMEVKQKIVDEIVQDIYELKQLVQNDENSPRKSELIIKCCFKYQQYIEFINKFYTSVEASDKKMLIGDKLTKFVRDFTGTGEEEKYAELKLVSNLDKFVKKEGKTVNFLEEKYVNRFVEYLAICEAYQNEIEKLKKKNDKKSDRTIVLLQKRQNVYKEELVELKKLIRASVMPFHSIEMKTDIVQFQKDMHLYEYTNFKDKVICQKEKEVVERNGNHDKKILKSITNYNYVKANINDLSRMLHNIIIDENRVPFMVQMLELFASAIIKQSDNISEQVFLGFIETYLYIRNFIQKNEIDEDVQEVYEKVVSQIEKYLKNNKKDVYEIQMRHLYEYLEPLSRFDENKPRLDKWQKDVFEFIDQKKNVIVIAPTSSGKTVLSTYCSIISEKLLFVVPSAELARQVCGMIRNLVLENKIKRNITLVTEKDTYSDSATSFDILVGTPGALESYFVEKDIETTMFDYVVFDEIHQLNQNLVGAELERLVKWITSDYCSDGKTKFLALSACVGNAEQLHAWWKQFVSDIELVYCNRRFLQQQKFLWNDGALKRINPLSVCSLEFLQKNGFVHNGVVKSDMAFTPDDLYDLYDKMRPIPGFGDRLHPNRYFKTMRISLDNCKEWELDIKHELQKLSRNRPEDVQKILDGYQNQLDGIVADMSVEDLYKLLKTLQKNNMLPTILFRLDPCICQQKFTELVYYLKERESKVYPTYYEDLKMRNDHYLEYMEKDKKLDSMELPASEQLEEMNMTPQMYMEDKKRQLREKEIISLVKKYSLRMNSHIEYANTKLVELKESEKDLKKRVDAFRAEKQKQKSLEDKEEKASSTKKKQFEEELKNIKDYKDIYSKQLKYYERELKKIADLEEINSVNIYKPHPEFTFLDEFITSEHIIEFRKQLMDYMKEEKREQERMEKRQDKDKDKDSEKEKAEFRKDTYISYDHPFIIGIERGVVLYLNRLPTPFQRVAQSLIASTMKLAPVTFSDQSLAFGINYPIRSVILSGGHIDPIVAHQMIGRAGRRGVDPKGYTIYCDVDWRTIVKEKYLEVNGSDVLDSSVWIIPGVWFSIRTSFAMVAGYHLRDFNEKSVELEMKYEKFMEDMSCIIENFDTEFDHELAPEGIIQKMKYDIYKNKKYGLQSLLMPYLLEELSRWKFNYNNMDPNTKYEILRALTNFYNGNMEDEVFSEHFRLKTKQWKCFDSYFKKNDMVARRLEDKVDESDIPYWISVAELLGNLYEMTSDWRIRKLIGVIYSDIKVKTKKYTF
jgi:hypothetical protein